MSAPFRIHRYAPAAVAAAPPAPDPIRQWIERLIKLIPSEIVAVYLAGRTLAPNGDGIWSLVCLGLLFVVRIWGTCEPGKPPQWIAIGISAASFVIWVLAMGGDFPGLHPTPALAGRAVLVWVTVVSAVYKGD